MKENWQVIIIGGGPAGLAAACALRDKGIEDILVLEREQEPGGILRQCIHDGFGLTRFRESLSGPEYAQRFLDRAVELGIEIRTDTTVISLQKDHTVTAVSQGTFCRLRAKAVILTMGCRERPRGALSIPGDRPAGVFTAGVAQNYVNMRNTMIGHRVVILGSGDIGMIMARRLTLEGAKVEAVFEVLPYPSGLPRNIEQCLNDYGIPLYLSHTVTRIHGRKRVEAVTVSQVDEAGDPIPGTERYWPCDTLILSCGLIPENELSLEAGVVLDEKTRGARVDEYGQTSVSGIFAAGNVLHVHDLVDFVSLEAEKLAQSVCLYLQDDLAPCPVPVERGDGISYVLPQAVSGKHPVELSFRVAKPIKDAEISVFQGGVCIAQRKVKKAIPAVMLHLEVPAEAFGSNLPVKVVCRS